MWGTQIIFFLLGVLATRHVSSFGADFSGFGDVVRQHHNVCHAYLAEGLLLGNLLYRWEQRRMLRRREVLIGYLGDGHSSATKLICGDARGQRTYVSLIGRDFYITHEVNLCQHQTPVIVAH